MQNKLVHDIKRYVKLGLEEWISQIFRNRHDISMLSKSDLKKIMNYMDKINKHSVSILEYIIFFQISPPSLKLLICQ